MARINGLKLNELGDQGGRTRQQNLYFHNPFKSLKWTCQDLYVSTPTLGLDRGAVGWVAKQRAAFVYI